MSLQSFMTKRPISLKQRLLEFALVPAELAVDSIEPGIEVGREGHVGNWVVRDRDFDMGALAEFELGVSIDSDPALISRVVRNLEVDLEIVWNNHWSE